LRTSPLRVAHPIVYLFLIVPFGAMGGYLSVAIGYQLTQAGVSVGEVAALIAVSLIPQTWKFLWAPVADTTWTRKRWYVLDTQSLSQCARALAATPTASSTATASAQRNGSGFLGASADVSPRQIR